MQLFRINVTIEVDTASCTAIRTYHSNGEAASTPGTLFLGANRSIASSPRQHATNILRCHVGRIHCIFDEALDTTMYLLLTILAIAISNVYTLPLNSPMLDTYDFISNFPPLPHPNDQKLTNTLSQSCRWRTSGPHSSKSPLRRPNSERAFARSWTGR